MEKKKKAVFPKGFFTKLRPTMSLKEALRDVEPFKWCEDVLNGKKKAIIYSKKS